MRKKFVIDKKKLGNKQKFFYIAGIGLTASGWNDGLQESGKCLF